MPTRRGATAAGRSHSAAHVRARSLEATRLAPAQAPFGPRGQPGGEPVSYTHLRAHETSAHL
eukprot:11487316-Alexandrium_andersonii.AAC.1